MAFTVHATSASEHNFNLHSVLVRCLTLCKLTLPKNTAAPTPAHHHFPQTSHPQSSILARIRFWGMQSSLSGGSRCACGVVPSAPSESSNLRWRPAGCPIRCRMPVLRERTSKSLASCTQRNKLDLAVLGYETGTIIKHQTVRWPHVRNWEEAMWHSADVELPHTFDTEGIPGCQDVFPKFPLWTPYGVGSENKAIHHNDVQSDAQHLADDQF